MACYFCRDVSTESKVHEACKSTLAGGFAQRTQCTKCGKCRTCDRPELEEKLRRQPYAIMQISKRRYGIVRISNHIGLSMMFRSGQYIGPHRTVSFVSGCEKLDYDTAKQRLADLLYNLNNNVTRRS